MSKMRSSSGCPYRNLPPNPPDVDVTTIFEKLSLKEVKCHREVDSDIQEDQVLVFSPLLSGYQ